MKAVKDIRVWPLERRTHCIEVGGAVAKQSGTALATLLTDSLDASCIPATR